MSTPTELAAKTGISIPFASQVINGKRKPSIKVALDIFDKTGLKFGMLEKATDAEIETLRRLQEAA